MRSAIGGGKAPEDLGNLELRTRARVHGHLRLDLGGDRIQRRALLAMVAVLT
jgi:hypothetical protein